MQLRCEDVADAVGSGKLAELFAGEAATVITHDDLWKSMSGECHAKMVDCGARADVVDDPDVRPFAVGINHNQEHFALNRSRVINMDALPWTIRVFPRSRGHFWGGRLT